MNRNTFFKYFDMLTDAPNGVPKLRERILQLAVQGKLVPRNPDDEPASVLPEKIEAEKERLVKEKKIKLSAPPHLPVTPCKNTVFALLRKRFDLLRLENIIREIKIFKFLSDIPHFACLYNTLKIKLNSSKLFAYPKSRTQ